MVFSYFFSYFFLFYFYFNHEANLLKYFDEFGLLKINDFLNRLSHFNKRLKFLQSVKMSIPSLHLDYLRLSDLFPSGDKTHFIKQSFMNTE